MECTALKGNKCVSPVFQLYDNQQTDGFKCGKSCWEKDSLPYSEWDGSKCYCSTTTCTGFVPAPGREYWFNEVRHMCAAMAKH